MTVQILGRYGVRSVIGYDIISEFTINIKIAVECPTMEFAQSLHIPVKESVTSKFYGEKSRQQIMLLRWMNPYTPSRRCEKLENVTIRLKYYHI